jgi:hypothetical protein
VKNLVPGRSSEEFEKQLGKSLSYYWDCVVRRFSGCKLAFNTDKLIALSGIAHEVHTMMKAEYLAGLWSRDLPFNLLWYTPASKSGSVSRDYIAPSWSWASVDESHICFPDFIEQKHEEDKTRTWSYWVGRQLLSTHKIRSARS